MKLLKHYKNGLWLVNNDVEAEAIMNEVGGCFTTKDITPEEVEVLKKFDLI